MWPGHDLDLYACSIRNMLICYLLRRLGSLLAKFGLAAVISPVLGADMAISDYFEL